MTPVFDHEAMVTGTVVAFFVLGILVQFVVIAVAVHAGTAAIRRELFDLRQDLAAYIVDEE